MVSIKFFCSAPCKVSVAQRIYAWRDAYNDFLQRHPETIIVKEEVLSSLKKDLTLESLDGIDIEVQGQAPTLSPEEHAILHDPKLLELIDEELSKKIEGELKARKAIFLCCCGKYVTNGGIASYNLLINSSSGTGKDFVSRQVLSIFPENEVVIRTRISPTAFTYWHNSKFEPEWTWSNKVCLLSDISDNILNSEVFKLMASDGTHSTVVIKQQAVDICIKGKPVLFVTTAGASPKSEMLRRFPIMQLDESAEQTQHIKKRQARMAALGKSFDYSVDVRNALSKLRPCKVIVPFAEKLPVAFPNDNLIMRTHFGRLLDYCKASAALHQYQRKIDPSGFIVAEPADYDNARLVLECTTSNAAMIPLTAKQRKILDIIINDFRAFKMNEIIPKCPFISESKLYEAIDMLVELGFLCVEYQESETSKKPVKWFTLMDQTVLAIPTWDDVQKKGN